jgi:CrcB protein
LGLAWKTPPGHFPAATFVVNITGSFLLGVVLTVLPARRRYGRAFLGVGLLGGWTTMSTFAVEADLLVNDGHFLMAVLYLAATVVVGVAAAWLGAVVARGKVAWPSG